jgi:hypothetical protein
MGGCDGAGKIDMKKGGLFAKIEVMCHKTS